MEGVSNFPSTFVDTNPDYSSKNLDTLISQGHTLNALQMVNKDIFHAGKDSQIESLRQSADVRKEVADVREVTLRETLQAKNELAGMIKDEGSRTRDLIYAQKASDQAAEIAFLKAQILKLS